MNREIKFRAWDGECFYTPILYNELIFKTDMDFENYYDSKDEVNQYTGLKDKNGKEIYEGDIVKQIITRENIKPQEYVLYEIVFEDGQFTYKKGNYLDCMGLKYIAKTFEVTGNIYEDPELLEVQHD